MAKGLRLWLMQQPRPSAVRVKSADGERTVEMSQQTTWTEHAKTIASLDPLRLEALSGDGAVLRAVDAKELDLGAVSAATAVVDEEEDAVTAAAAAAIAPTTVLVPMDAVVRLLLTISRLLADAHSQRTDVAFNRLVSLFDAVAEQSRNQQRQLEALRTAMESGARQQTKKGGGIDDMIMAAFLNGHGAGAQAMPAVMASVAGVAASEAPAPAANTNGAGAMFDKFVDKAIDRFLARVNLTTEDKPSNDDDDDAKPSGEEN